MIIDITNIGSTLLKYKYIMMQTIYIHKNRDTEISPRLI